ncbi:MAG TPA: ABC transporter substrate-binding protein [Mycobacteriales bacterium]|nr:ABC transporter substrate-binding protein [Mycobacteriales bacterium]
MNAKLRRRLAVLGLPLVLAIVAACGSSGTASAPADSNAASGLTKSTIVIGNIGQYSGSTFADLYVQTLHSLQAWVQWTNDHGGLNGHPVKLVSHDDQNNPAKSLQYVKEMVEQDHIVALLSPLAVGTDPAWANYVEQKKVPVIGGGSLDANWETNPYMLSTNVTSENYDVSQMYAAKSIGKKVGVFICAEFSACKTGISKFEGIAKQTGLAWAGAQSVAETATDYISQCIAMKQTGADVVLPETSATVMSRVIKACAEQGYTPRAVVPASNINASVIGDAEFDGTLGVNFSPLWFVDSDFTKDWKQQYTKMFPHETLYGDSTFGWQAGVVFGTALKDAPDTVTSETVLQGLYAQPAGTTFGGWTPPLTFKPGKSTQTQPCMWYLQIKGGKLVAPQGNKPVCAPAGDAG